MAGAQTPISDMELEVLKVLWEQGAATVRQLVPLLRQQGYHWAYNTVLTLLQRLHAKGYVRSNKRELAHVFRPVVSRAKLLRQQLKELADRICEGTAMPIMLALVESQRFTPAEIEHFRRLLDELEEKSSRQ